MQTENTQHQHHDQTGPQSSDCEEGWDPTLAHRALSTWKEENASIGGSFLAGAKQKVDHVYARAVRNLPWDKGEDRNAAHGGRLFDFHRVSPTVLVGRIPRSRGDVERIMIEEGVTAIVSAVEEWEMQAMGLTPEFQKSFQLRWLVLPTPDFSSPSMSNLVSERTTDTCLYTDASAEEATWWYQVSGALFMLDEDRSGQGGTIYVHCNRGRSRSCIVTLCFLMAKYGMSGKAALAHVRQTRSQVTLGPFFSSFWFNLGRYESTLVQKYRELQQNSGRQTIST